MQLNTIGAAPFINLMRYGHTSRLPYDKILDKFNPFIKNNAKKYPQNLARDLLNSTGCDTQALTFGRTQIFFRPTNEKYINLLLEIKLDKSKKLAKDLSDKFYIQQRRALFIRIRFIANCKLVIIIVIIFLFKQCLFIVFLQYLTL